LTEDASRDEGNGDDLRRVSGTTARTVPGRQLVRLPAPATRTTRTGDRGTRRVAQNIRVYRIWPDPDPTPLDDDALTALYAQPGPGVRVNFVTSADGAVEVEGRSKGLQNPADNRVFALLRQFPDALFVGAGTLRQEGYRAVRLDESRRAWRIGRGLDPYPRLVVASRRLDLDPTHPALADAPVRPVVVTCAASPPELRRSLAPVADVLVHGEKEVDLRAALADLRGRGMARILSEGGPHLFGSLTAADLVDEVCLTVSPLLAGPGAGRITAGQPSEVRDLKIAHVLYAEDAILLRYARNI
jgi:riboflavin biosynthesis pyrimidine reductase